MNLDGFDRIWLVGDEDCGVGLQCDAAECWDGGRPLAYLGNRYGRDDKVVKVSTVVALLAVGRAHLDEKHAR